MNNNYDVILIGSGPAGSSASAILAEYGHKVLVLEREKFPRYHIGESLLPFTFFPFKRLNLIDKMRKSAFIQKHSVQFVSQSGKASIPFYFDTRYETDVAQTWQVLRSEFDQMLMDNARSKGAEIIEEMNVREFIKEENKYCGVKAADKNGKLHEYRANMILDCSGRESLAASRNGWRIMDPKLNKVAVWTYFKGAMRDPGRVGGATTVAYVPEKGWFWYIPQHDDMISVGVVAEGKYLFRDGVKDLEKVFNREVDQNVWVKEHISVGKVAAPYRTTGEYSFRSKHCAANGLLLVGDAFGFLDPIFSSGVMLALKSGVMAGDAVHEALNKKDYSAAQFADYGKFLCEGIENMRSLVYAYYDQTFSFRKLGNKYPHLLDLVTDCLSGDVNKDFSELYRACGEFAEMPAPLPYGEPLVN